MQLNFSTKILRTGLILVVVGSVYLSAIHIVLGAVGVNRQIPFHGELVDEKGKPLNGEFNMTFAIYDAPTGGTTLWSGVYTSDNGNPVDVEEGEFRVLLGSGVGNELVLDFNDDTYYLGITVEGDTEMTPRERLGATGYAINSDRLDGLSASDFLRQNFPMTLSTSTSATLVALNQSGEGDIFTLANSTGEVFTVLADGYVGIGDIEPTSRLSVAGDITATNFISTDESGINVFAGALEVQSGDDSTFGGNVVLADGSGVFLANGNGISIYQDSSALSNLLLTPVGESAGGPVDILTPNSLSLRANTSDSSEPAFLLNDDGSASIYSVSQGDISNRIFFIDFTSGVEVTNGNLNVANGSVYIAGINALEPALIVDGDGGLRVNNLANAIDISFDSQGNIIPNYSDERLKQNIHTIDDALDVILNLRGVRYEWKDTDRFGEGMHIGFVAQELQKELPELVSDTGEYLSINAKNVTAVLVEAIKELHGSVTEYFARTERLEREVELLRSEINALKGVKTDTSERSEPVVNEEPDPLIEESATQGDVVPETEVIPEVVPEPEVIPEPELVTEGSEEVQP